jgi:hypothetical protein
MTSHVNRGKTVSKPKTGRKPWQNTKISNISELRSETTESKLVKTEFGRATGILCGPDWRQAHDSVGCRSLDEHLLFEALKTRRTGGNRSIPETPTTVNLGQARVVGALYTQLSAGAGVLSQSHRIATIGSLRAALSAGTSIAAKATTPRKAAAPVIVAGSCGAIP